MFIYARLVRYELEFQRIARYIEMNPVTAGLALWSSARPIANRPQVSNLPHIRSPMAM